MKVGRTCTAQRGPVRQISEVHSVGGEGAGSCIRAADYPFGVQRNPLPAAILFDLDGTIVDSEPYWIAVEMELAARDGGRWSHADGLSLIGNDLQSSAVVLRERGGIRGTNDEIIADLIAGVERHNRESGVRWRPGALALIEMLHTAGVPCAIVTMSYRSLAEAVIQFLPEGSISALVTGDEVTHGKPHPEPYLRAARMLGVDPTHCIGIEDSPTGLASVEAAGVRSIGVPFLVHLHAATGRSRVDSLADLTLDDLRDIAAGLPIDRVDQP